MDQNFAVETHSMDVYYKDTPHKQTDAWQTHQSKSFNLLAEKENKSGYFHAKVKSQQHLVFPGGHPSKY